MQCALDGCILALIYMEAVGRDSKKRLIDRERPRQRVTFEVAMTGRRRPGLVGLPQSRDLPFAYHAIPSHVPLCTHPFSRLPPGPARLRPRHHGLDEPLPGRPSIRHTPVGQIRSRLHVGGGQALRVRGLWRCR